MKTLVHATPLLACMLFACWTAEATTNIVGVLLAESRFQRETNEVRPELERAVSSAVLIVKAKVLNSDSAVEASPRQQEVSTGQGWRAALLRTTRVFRGDQQAGLLWVANGAFRAGPTGMQWRYPVEAKDGQECILVLEQDKKLSRWCQTNVFAIVRGLEVK